MAPLHLSFLLSALLIAFSSALAQVAEPQPSDVVRAGGIEFHFASADQARQVLGRRDRFVDQMSPFDREARMQTTQDPGIEAYLDFVVGEARDWSAAGQAAVSRAIELLDDPLSELALPEVGPILLVHTTGREESGAAYTRGSAIVLPPHYTGTPENPKQRLIAHELFHVISRKHPELRDKLYSIIGFRFVGPLAPPASLAERTITNPDAPVIEHVIDLKLADDSSATVSPILFSPSEFDPQKSRRLFGYLQFRLMEVKRGDQRKWSAKLDGGEPILHVPEIADFHRQIGRNTGYIIHPEEILAENFASLVTGSKVKDQWLIDAMEKTFVSYGKPSTNDE